MFSEEGSISPMKKLKILSEKQQNVKKTIESPVLEPIKEKFTNTQEEPKTTTNIEPLLQESAGQYVIFPINHDDMWKMYKQLVDNFWSVTETIQQLDTMVLNYNEKQFMKYFSSIFASPESQGLVNENFAEQFCKLIQVTEAKFFYGHQLFVQNIHFEMYNKLLDKFMDSNEEREKLYKIVENFDAVAKKRKWISDWKNKSFAEQIMASACLHGLLFSSIELITEWIKRKFRSSFHHELVDIFNRMIHDQELQRDFACLMLSHLKTKPTKEIILETINQAAKLEFDFLINGLKLDLVEIDFEDVIQLIDRKTKVLKLKIFDSFEEKKKVVSESETKKNTIPKQEDDEVSKENHQKLVFDEDF